MTSDAIYIRLRPLLQGCYDDCSVTTHFQMFSTYQHSKMKCSMVSIECSQEDNLLVSISDLTKEIFLLDEFYQNILIK